MSTIRVGTITYDWFPYDPLVHRIANAAVDAGYEMDIICARQPHEKSYEVLGGVRVYRLPMNRVVGKSLLFTVLCWCWFLLQAAFKVSVLHLKRRYDVIHVHNMPDFLVFASILPRLLGAKVILHVQDVSPELMAAKAKGPAKKWLTHLAALQERISTTYADCVVTVGWPFEELLLQRGVPEEKIVTILNSADPKVFPASRRCPAPADVTTTEKPPFIVMYHGTAAARNGLDTAVKAVALALPEVPDLQLHIQGRGEHLHVVEQLAQELGVGDRVEFREPCSCANKIVEFVIHGDVGIIPYHKDGFMELILPTKAYEFSWMHRPMIASDTSAIRSMFRPQSIALCDCNKPEEFARAIIDLYQHPEKRAQMVADAAEDYRPFEWEVMAKRYQQLLLSLSRRPMKTSFAHNATQR